MSLKSVVRVGILLWLMLSMMLCIGKLGVLLMYRVGRVLWFVVVVYYCCSVVVV